MRLGNSSRSPTIAGLVLEHLCPSIQNILEDGLRDHKLDLIIGQRRNHPWSVVEVSTTVGEQRRLYREVPRKPGGVQIRSSGWTENPARIWMPHVVNLSRPTPGPSTKVLHRLVCKIRACPQLLSHCMRLRAFVMGLLK